jgi:hypothetical protein
LRIKGYPGKNLRIRQDATDPIWKRSLVTFKLAL